MMDRAPVDFTSSFAEVYDRYLVPMDFAPHAARLSKHVSATAPRRVLETAAGTGALTRELARILPGDVGITATDLNEPMIALAQSNLHSERILWRQADALDLPFGDAEFDVVVCQFGVMFFPDKQQGFHEALRVLRPGGHFLFNVWDSFEANSKSPLRIAARIVGAILDRDPVSLLSSPYHDQGIIRSDLGAAGFVHVGWKRYLHRAVRLQRTKQLRSFVTAPGSARTLTRATQLALKKSPVRLPRRSDPGSGLGRSRGPLKH